MRSTPWTGRATRLDVALLAALGAAAALDLALRPVTPFLLASQPVLLAVLGGDLAAVGAAAAFARLGEVPVWLVVAAGVAGGIKVDWLVWWVGRRWGRGVVEMVAPKGRVRDAVLRASERDTRVLRLAVVLAPLPGVPGALVFAAAGRSGMPLATFLLLDLLGLLVMTSSVTAVGFGLGRHAVEVVLWVDEHAGLVSLGVVAVLLTLPWLRRGAAAAARRVRAS